ncbi:hypothetical protein Tco_1099283 [Tanacetum coccineum]
MHENTVCLWLKDHQDVMEKLAQQQAAAFQALFDTLRAKLQETRRLLQNQFEESVKNRFGPSKYEDSKGALLKLLQLGTVEDYQREFEKLMNRVTVIPDSLLICFYISWLKLHLQQELSVSKPTILGTSAGLEANKVVNDGDVRECFEMTHLAAQVLPQCMDTWFLSYFPILVFDNFAALRAMLNPNTRKQEKERRTCIDYLKYKESCVMIKSESILEKKKSNYSSFQDLRSSCNEDMVKYEGPWPSTTRARTLNEKSNKKIPTSRPSSARLRDCRPLEQCYARQGKQCHPALGAHDFLFTLEET